jgi:tRNA modification GTPase
MIAPNDTIAAIATPPGAGAIAVIRISGPGAIAAADRAFRGSAPLCNAPSHTVHYGHVVDESGVVVDDVLAAVFVGPRSYTGEDVVEISCHGGLVVTEEVFAAILGAGARQAEPGEFTRRAFLNGKMDLSQAEAVGALISASSRNARRASLEQLHGRLADSVGTIRDELTRLCALLEIDLDFSEEGLSIVSQEEIAGKMRECRGRLENMAETFNSGRLYRDGVSAVIIGAPNVGKSSLFNALLRENRAIVTAIPGTTRDFLEESVTIGGVLFKLTDTAGIRESSDPAEAEGIRRSRRAVEHADIVLHVLDASAPSQGSLDVSVLTEHQKLITVWNKIDSAGERAGSSPASTAHQVSISARTGEGVHELSETLVGCIKTDTTEPTGGVQVTTQRHWRAIRTAIERMDDGLASLAAGRTNEFIAFDVREAAASLGEITGIVSSEDVLNSIFASFCIGK